MSKPFKAYWAARHQRKQASHEPHPTLWVVLALVSALLGSAASLWRSADDEPKLAIAKHAPELVGGLLSADVPASAGSAVSATPVRTSR